MNNARMCPRCGSQRFNVTIHATQDWTVDGNGNMIKVNDDCVEVTHFADNSDIWDCDVCGYSAPGSAFITHKACSGKSWNPVLNLIKNIKNDYVEMFGEDNMWEHDELTSCINIWVNKMVENGFGIEYQKMLEPLTIKQFGKRVLIKYMLIEAYPGFWDAYGGLYRECRSVVIDLEHMYLVLTPFRKFFNMNEIEETQEHIIREKIANAQKVEISDKLDGSMISARYVLNELVVSSSGSLNPETSLHCKLGYDLLSKNDKKMIIAHPNYTFLFELISPKDAHVVSYKDKEEGLYLIGARDVTTGYELPYDSIVMFAKQYNVKRTEVFNKTFDEVVNSLDDKNSDEAEGFVINIDNYKLKLKYNDYVTVHRMLSKMISTNTLIKVVDEGTWDDLKSKLPVAYLMQAQEIVDNVTLYIRGMNKLVQAAYIDTKKNYTESATHDAREDRRNYCAYAFNNHKEFAHYLMCLYDSKPLNFIRSAAGRYMRYYEIVNDAKRRGFYEQFLPLRS